jgi:hypothetical protein
VVGMVTFSVVEPPLVPSAVVRRRNPYVIADATFAELMTVHPVPAVSAPFRSQSQTAMKPQLLDAVPV